MIDVQLVNSEGDLKVDLHKGFYGEKGIVSFHQPLIKQKTIFKEFTSDDYGTDMNKSLDSCSPGSRRALRTSRPTSASSRRSRRGRTSAARS